MKFHDRRAFLNQVGRGMVVASVGSTLARDLGLSVARAEEGVETLALGSLDSLAGMLEETPIERLLPLLMEKVQAGVSLKDLVAAAALANARKFGGEDYIGFHTLMAMAPAWHMSRVLPKERAALPIFKVLYRNTKRIQSMGGRSTEVLHPLAAVSGGPRGGEALRDAVRSRDMNRAESIFAAGATGGAPEDALNELLWAVEDNTEVHRVVLAYRSYALLDLVGREHAHTMLRQSVRYCVVNEKSNSGELPPLLAGLLDRHKLLDGPIPERQADDAWLEALCDDLLKLSGSEAAGAIAAALAEGFSPDTIGEAIAMCANQIVLRDSGRPAKYADALKPAGSVHGDSLGVHASDAVNAWRNIARVADLRHQRVAMILAGYEVARDAKAWESNLASVTPRPSAAAVEAIGETRVCSLLGDLDDAIVRNDQANACAIVERYGDLGYSPNHLFRLMLKYAISEDGALHAEKYYHTVSEEFASARPAFRFRHLVALARVTASEFGRRAEGYEEACRLLGV